VRRAYRSKLLRDACVAKGWTPADVVRAAHGLGHRITLSSVTRHLSGDAMPNARTLGLYADVLHLPTDAFYEYT